MPKMNFSKILSDKDLNESAKKWSNYWGLNEEDLVVCRLGFPVFLQPKLTLDVFYARLKVAVIDRTTRNFPLFSLNHPGWWIADVWRQNQIDETLDLYVIRMWESLRKIGYFDPDTGYVVSPLLEAGIDLTVEDDQRRVLKWLDGFSDEQLDKLLLYPPKEYEGADGLRLAQKEALTILEDLEANETQNDWDEE